MIELRPYQEDISTKAAQIISRYKVVVLSMEVRTGKTITALSVASKLSKKNVLFLTKKKAISSIQSDYDLLGPDYNITIINYESIHKISGDFDMVVCDECHILGAFPKPSKKHKDVKKLYGHLDMILMSGTTSPESYSQLFHQFFTSKHGPWRQYSNFYNWAKSGYVKLYTIRTSYGVTNQYDKADYDKIMRDVSKLIITFTQKQAGFISSVEENILYVDMTPQTYDLVRVLKRDKVIESGDEVILADTMVKEQSKVHQIYSGTIKTESGNAYVLDSSKGLFIKKYFIGKKIAIYYNFKAELTLLEKVFGDMLTTDLDTFNQTDKNIALQIVSGREGISLKEADYIVFFNISFSAVSYWQARDRLTTKERTENTVFWIFARGGLEDKIYKAVKQKKSFTSKMYKQLGENS